MIAIAAIALFACSAIPVIAQKPGVVLDSDPGWQKIGETVATFKSQNESISVLGADEFAAIKIKVEDAPLHIDRLQVFYESGDMEEIEVKKRIDAGEESEVFRLEHPDRDIQKVAFTYNTEANTEGEKAGVMLYGLKTERSDRDAYQSREDAERVREPVERESDELRKKADEAKDQMDERGARTRSDLERAADETGDAISEAAAKAAAEVDDPRHETKVGPDGQTIYIGDDSRPYYINDQGKRVYVRETQLRDKPDGNR